MRFAIIGSGGAGMTSAWLLDGNHDVTVYERNAQLGGHAHSTPVEKDGRTYHADDGFCWFSDALYPNFMRLLELNGVPTRIVPMSATFTQAKRERTFLLPPVGTGPLLRTVLNVPMLMDLIQLNRAISLAEPLVREHDRDMTWGEFIQRHRFPAAFLREVLTPMIAGTWGGPYDRVNDFSAYVLMKYLVFHRPSGLSQYPWHVVKGGASSYIDKVASGLGNTTIRRNTRVAHLHRTERGWTVIDGDGRKDTFDQVIMATGAKDARAILRNVSGIDTTRSVLEKFEYYAARVATHGDTSFMPARRDDWRVANIRWDGEAARLNVWVGREGNADVFTSYVGDRLPDPCYNVSTFHLPLITPAFHRAQGELSGLQGKDRLWFTGDWTHDIGCHEDAVVSAVRVCQALDPSSARLAALRSPRVHPVESALPGGRPSLPPRPTEVAA
jgi:predicted NAD/FAD-binding protein